MFKTKFSVTFFKMLSPKSVSLAEISYCVIKSDRNNNFMPNICKKV